MGAIVRPVPNAQIAVSEGGTDLGVVRQFDFPDVDVAGGVATVNVAAGAAHTHSGADIASGTVDDARIAATLARDTEVTSAVGVHEAAANPHPTYETSAEAQAKVDAHAAASDPHPTYLTAAEGNAAYDVIGAAAAAQAASQPVDSDLTAVAALSTTTYGRAFLALANEAAGRTALGLGTAASAATGDFDATGAAAAAQAASQPVDSDLTAIAALATTIFGRGLLALADQAALLAAAGASASGHDHSGTYQPADADISTVSASQAEMEAGTEAALRSVSPLRVAQAIAALGGAGDIATDAIWDAAGDLVQGTGANTGAKLGAGTAAMFLKSAGAAAANLWAFPPGHQFDYVAITASVTINGTTEAGANTLITGSSVAYDGSTAIIVEGYSSRITLGASGTIIIDLYDDATILGRVGIFVGSSTAAPFYFQIRVTPTAASHVYTLKGWRATADGSFVADTGGTGKSVAAFLRITKA